MLPRRGRVATKLVYLFRYPKGEGMMRREEEEAEDRRGGGKIELAQKSNVAQRKIIYLVGVSHACVFVGWAVYV